MTGSRSLNGSLQGKRDHGERHNGECSKDQQQEDDEDWFNGSGCETESQSSDDELSSEENRSRGERLISKVIEPSEFLRKNKRIAIKVGKKYCEIRDDYCKRIRNEEMPKLTGYVKVRKAPRDKVLAEAYDNPLVFSDSDSNSDSDSDESDDGDDEENVKWFYVSSARNRNKQYVRQHALPSTIVLPPMKFYETLNRNESAEDCKHYSHFPFFGDNQNDEKLMQEYNTLFTEGIHGAKKGCGHYINDDMLFPLLKYGNKLVKKGETDHSTFNKIVYELFPNKLPLRQLETAYESLRDRFQPENATILSPVKCLKRYPSTPADENLPPRPCGDECYAIVKSDQIEKLHKMMPKMSNHVEMIVSTECAKQRSPCVTAKALFAHLREADCKPLSCREIFIYQKLQHGREFTPPLPVVHEALNNGRYREQHKRFQAYLKAEQDNTVYLNKILAPCTHTGPCDGDCGCVVCTKYCQCEGECQRRFVGCRCSKGQCRTTSCSCFLARFECDPELCTTCGTDETDPNSCCKNMQIYRGNSTELRVEVSIIPNAGWGCVLCEDVKKDQLVSEYCGERISADECERRGRLYDIAKTSYTFTLNEYEAIDATRRGNLIRFANSAPVDKANCYSKVMFVDGSQRIGIYAKKDLAKDTEIFFDYRYTKEHQDIHFEKNSNEYLIDGKPKKKAKKPKDASSKKDDSTKKSKDASSKKSNDASSSKSKNTSSKKAKDASSDNVVDAKKGKKKTPVGRPRISQKELAKKAAREDAKKKAEEAAKKKEAEKKASADRKRRREQRANGECSSKRAKH